MADIYKEENVLPGTSCFAFLCCCLNLRLVMFYYHEPKIKKLAFDYKLDRQQEVQQMKNVRSHWRGSAGFA